MSDSIPVEELPPQPTLHRMEIGVQSPQPKVPTEPTVIPAGGPPMHPPLIPAQVETPGQESWRPVTPPPPTEPAPLIIKRKT